MGYYIRILGKNDARISIEDLRASLPTGSRFEIEAEGLDMERWSQIILRHQNGPDIALIERNPVVPGGLGKEEIDEFAAEIEGEKPTSAARWLHQYLPTVTVIYALQLLKGADVDDGWNAVHAVQSRIWSRVGGILQADGEGFSNEDGYHILWQFSEDVDGDWSMAVLGDHGKWTAFKMNLGEPAHRLAFLQGKVPSGVAPIN